MDNLVDFLFMHSLHLTGVMEPTEYCASDATLEVHLGSLTVKQQSRHIDSQSHNSQKLSR